MNKIEMTPEQSKEFFKDPVRRAALWDAAIDKYIKNGADFDETVRGLSDEIGLPEAAIIEGLRPHDAAAKSLIDEMWSKQDARRQIGEGV